MKTYYSTDHDSFYPTGVASVVVAKDEMDARVLLVRALNDKGLNPNEGIGFTLHEMKPGTAKVLVDGNY